MNIRFWVERNNVYFQVVAAILLSGMSLLVAYLQYSLSQDQLKLTELELSPLIVVRESTILDSMKNRIRVIEFENARGHISNFESRLDGYVAVTYEPAGTQHVKLTNIYDRVYPTGASQGLLVRYVIRENEIKDQWYLDKVSSENRDNYFFLCRQRRIVSISFRDYQGRKDSSHYEIQPDFAVSKLRESRARILGNNMMTAVLFSARKLSLDSLLVRTFGSKIRNLSSSLTSSLNNMNAD